MEKLVSLHAEGVDWNAKLLPDSRYRKVSLHAEGVDWNAMVILYHTLVNVSLHAEGVDWNSFSRSSPKRSDRLPPCGGSGLKFLGHKLFIANDCLPPCGGSGLKYSQVHYTTIYNMSPSMRREWIEISTRIFIIFPSVGLPPCGGSGLKCRIAPQYACKYWSPSMRREWIEMTSGK